EGLYASARLATDVELAPFGMRSRLDLRVVPGIAKVARSGGYQLMHTHSPRGALVGVLAASLAPVPVVPHLHDPTPPDTEHAFRNYRNSLIERLCIRKARHGVAVSRFVAGYARSVGVPTERTTVVWNGVESRPEKQSMHDRHRTVGAVALFRPRKGIEVLI